MADLGGNIKTLFEVEMNYLQVFDSCANKIAFLCRFMQDFLILNDF
jgi:hypothetical protein